MGAERRRSQALPDEEVRPTRVEQTDAVGAQLDAIRADIEIAKRECDEVIAATRARLERLERYDRSP